MKKLYLVDVSSMFFRAFYAVRMLNNSKGLPTNAIYGFLSMSLKLLRDIKPEYMVYCYDRPEPSFRKDLDPNYKANRSEMPEDLSPQIPYIKSLTDALGIPSLDKETFEADDVIGTLASLGEREKLEVVIVSGDKDFAQLINNRVTMFDTMKNKKYDPQGVIDKWGVRPDQFIDYLAICGDSSDNIPGVKGIGPKGATTLLAQFETLDGIYENLDKVKSKSHIKKLEAAKESAYLSKTLVTIVRDIPIDLKLADLGLRPLQKEDLGAILDELEFNAFKKTLLGEQASPAPAPPNPESAGAAQILEAETPPLEALEKDEKSLEKWLSGGDNVFVWTDARQVCLLKDNQVVTFEGTPDWLPSLLQKKKILWKGYNLKKIWRAWGITGGSVGWDHKLAAYLLKPGAIKSYEDILQLYCGKTLSEFPNGVEIMGTQLALESVLKAKLKENKMLPILQTLDLPLIEVLASMETLGIELDVDFLKSESEDLAKDIAKIQKEIFAESGEEFNVASPKQVGVVLFEKMKLPPGKKTKTGFSTSEDVLSKLVDEYPIASKILKFRELSKLKSTYVDALPDLVNADTGRIHTDLNQALTTTGRLSSSHPNLQNIPIRSEKGERVRRAFVAQPGKLLVSADYSQIELRVLAHISKDKGMQQAFHQDRDIHSWTAGEVFSVALEDVTSDHRRKAKAVNFGIAYGQGVHGLSEALSIPRGEAKDIIANYFKKFPGVQDYMTTVVENAKETGYVETLFGRRRYLPELFSKNGMHRAFGERAAINAPIQGTASDLVKMAMLEIFDDFPEQMLLQVHDELIFEIPEDDVQDAADRIRETMENCVNLTVPLKVNIAWGKNWSEAH